MAQEISLKDAPVGSLVWLTPNTRLPDSLKVERPTTHSPSHIVLRDCWGKARYLAATQKVWVSNSLFF